MSGKTGQVSVIYCAEAFGKTIEPQVFFVMHYEAGNAPL
jgi:hypothetical protein